MRIEIRAHRQVHRLDFLFLPRDVAEDRISAYVQDLGIKRGELLAVRVERRQLRRSSWSPVQRMESHHHKLLPPEIAQPDFELPLTLYSKQLEIRCRIARFQCHRSLPRRTPLIATILFIDFAHVGSGFG